MKKLLCLMLATLLALSSFGLSVFAEGEATPADDPTPIFYENFDDAKVEDYTGDLDENGLGSVVLKNNTPSKLKVNIKGDGEDKSFHFQTRNTNDSSQTLFKLYDLPENVTDYAVFMRVTFDSARTNWSTKATSRVGLAFGIEDGKNFVYQDLRYNGSTKAINMQTVVADTQTSTEIGKEAATVLDTEYEMGIVVSNGQIYSFINGKLIQMDAEGTTSMADPSTGRGIGIYGAYIDVFVDEFRVYDCAYLPEGYDALTASAYEGDPTAVPMPAPAVKVIGAQRSTVAEGAYSLRLIAQISGTDYTAAGFKVTATSGGNSGTEQVLACTSAYTSILAEVDGSLQAKAAADDCYLIAVVIENIPVEGYENITFTVTPYVANGTTETEGTTAAFVLDNAEITSATWVK